MTTIETAFGGGVELVDLDKGSAIPLGFVFQLANKLAPSHVTNSFGEAVVLDHVHDLQTLHAYDLVLSYELSREFVLIVPSSITDTSMYLCYLATGFVSVLRAFFLLRMPTLGFCQLLLILGKELGVPVRMPIARNHHGLQAQVKPDLLVDYWQVVDFLHNEDGDEIHPSGRRRLQRMLRGSVILARVSFFPSHLKAELI